MAERYRANVTDYQRQLNTRANTTATAIQQSDERIARAFKTPPDSREAVKPVSNLAAIEIEPFNAIKRANTDARTELQNQSVQKKLTILNIGLISAAVILLIAIISLGFITKNKYSETRTLNSVINEQQMRVNQLNRVGEI